MKTKDQPDKNRPSRLLYIVFGLLLMVALGLYVIETARISRAYDKNTELLASIHSLEQQADHQEVVNKGEVWEDGQDDVATPKGEIGLLDGKIAFTLPSDWSSVPVGYCNGGFRGSSALCLDTAAIAPNNPPASVIDDTGVARWRAQVAVFESRGIDNAREWYENEYEDYIGDKYQVTMSDLDGKNYMIVREIYNSRVHYVFMDGNYAVHMSAQLLLEPGYGGYPGTSPYDFRDTYDSILQQFFESVVFRE